MLSQYDQSVYDAGYKYIPQSQYLLNPFQVPAGSENEVPTGIATTYQAQNMMGGGGGGFNPYNPDMSQIRTDFDPRAYNLAMRQGNTVGPNPDLFFAPQSKIGAAMDFIPGIGTIKRGAEFLKGMLPINERAILENEARGAGIFTDDIGRIVSSGGDINTGQNIMAGYNLNKVTRQTINDRRAMINEKMKDPAQKAAKLKALDDFERSMFGSVSDEEFIGPYDITGGITNRKNIITKYRKDKKAAEAAAKKAEEDRKLQEEIDAYNAAQAEKVRRSRDSDNDGVPDYVENAGGSYDGGYYGSEGGFENTGTTTSSNTGGGYSGRGGGADMGASTSDQGYTSSGPFAGLARGGRVYYMNGGLADLVDIYD